MIRLPDTFSGKAPQRRRLASSTEPTLLQGRSCLLACKPVACCCSFSLLSLCLFFLFAEKKKIWCASTGNRFLPRLKGLALKPGLLKLYINHVAVFQRQLLCRALGLFPFAAPERRDPSTTLRHPAVSCPAVTTHF